MRLTLAETKLIKDSITVIADLVQEIRLKVTPVGLELVAMDPANVAMVVFKLFSSAFVEYQVSADTTICVNLNDLKGVLRRVKPSDTITLELAENKLKVTLKSSSKREFLLPLIDMDEREQRVPELSFTARVSTTSDRFAEAIEDAETVGDSVAFSIGKDAFLVSSSNELSKAQIELPAEGSTTVKGPEGTRSKYSTEYLKRMIAAGKLADKVEVCFSRDYPLKLEYKIVDKMDLQFILAPRVEND